MLYFNSTNGYKLYVVMGMQHAKFPQTGGGEHYKHGHRPNNRIVHRKI